MFLCVCMSHPVHIQTHKTTYKLTNQTKLNSILMDLIWLKVLRNSCTVPYLFWIISWEAPSAWRWVRVLVIVWLPHKSFLSIELIPHKTLLTDIKRATAVQCVPFFNHPTILTELQIIPILPDSVTARRIFSVLLESRPTRWRLPVHKN